ncbi:MAG: PGPGW domain-containing protein, partial [Aeromicrobium sp.]
LMPLPGPGMLIVAGGVALLSRRHVWAQKVRGFVEKRAIDAAKYGVATTPRIVLSVLGGVWLFALGVVWWRGVDVPEFHLLNIGFGPELPGGRSAAFGLWLSALATWALIAFSVVRWRDPSPT